MNDRMSAQPPREFEPDEPEREPPVLDIASETPEADAIEQHQTVTPEDVDDELDTLPPDASEADALDQSRVVPLEDEDEV